MPTLPLTYNQLVVAHAAVDPAVSDLDGLVTWQLDVPDRQRRLYAGRSDALLAALQENEGLLHACHPFTQLRVSPSNVLTLRLNRVALRPAIVVPLMQRFVTSINPLEKESAVEAIRISIAPIARVVFLNRNRCDCRLSNLREIGPPPRLSTSGDNVS